MTDERQSEVKQGSEAIPFSEFLESTPPSVETRISDLTETVSGPNDSQWYELLQPELQLHCASEACNGTRFFRCHWASNGALGLKAEEPNYIYLAYVCSNCKKQSKIFSLMVVADRIGNSGMCCKFGEYPVYGPPTPARLIKLIGPDRETFLKGRRCENLGLGIGAFVYYRRVVENQKNRILDDILRVAEKLNASQDIVAALNAAKEETQFSQALASVKETIPQALLINGHNPLGLLHSALSDGLHKRSDEDCLDMAKCVRIVLGELSERLGLVLKDEAELKNAVSKLAQVKKASGRAKQGTGGPHPPSKP